MHTGEGAVPSPVNNPKTNLFYLACGVSEARP